MTFEGGSPSLLSVLIALTAAVLGILALASAMGGYLLHSLSWRWRLILFAAAACSLFPDHYHLWSSDISALDVVGGGLLRAGSHRQPEQEHDGWWLTIGVLARSSPARHSRNQRGMPLVKYARVGYSVGGGGLGHGEH